MDRQKPVQESRKCPTCGRAFLTEGAQKQCNGCLKEGKSLLNE